MTSARELPKFVLRYLRVAQPSALIAARLGIDAGDQVFEVERSIIVDGEPVMLIRNWLSRSRYPDFEAQFAVTGNVLRAMQQQHGISSVSQYKELEITILDEAEAELLDVQPGSPALQVTYITRMPDGEPIEFRRVIVRGDRCKCYVEQEHAEFLV
jgi:DNA-binding GntR family transcriptional regulator